MLACAPGKGWENMDVSIANSVGRGGQNLPNDIARINNLLGEIAMGPYYLPANMINYQSRPGENLQACRAVPAIDPGIVAAIEDFQRLCDESVTGLVKPGDTTLRRMNQLRVPLVLADIELAFLRNRGGIWCGYKISYSGENLPAGYRVFLRVSGAPVPFQAGDRITEPILANGFMDITARKKNNLICWDNLPDLLRMIDHQNLWKSAEGGGAFATLIVVKDQKVVSRSISKPVSCPVKPLTAPVSSVLGTANLGQVPPLPYNGAPNGGGGGGFIYHQPIDGKYYFEWEGKFATDGGKRGFDCITFVGAVRGVDANTGAMGVDENTITNHLASTPNCNMENKTSAQVKTFFETHKTGTYIVALHEGTGHVMLVIDGVYHEFNIPAGQPGYRTGGVLQYPFPAGGNCTVRKL
jgi:hypothetical protein